MPSDRCLVLTPDIDSQKAPQQFEVMRLVNELGIKPILTTELGITHLVSDSKEMSGLIRTLGQVDFTIVNLSGIDPNVYYVIGACHGLALPVILISDDFERLPKIFQGYPVIFYGSDIDDKDKLIEFRQKLRQAISLLFKQELHNPIEDYFPFEKRPVKLNQYLQMEKEKRDLLKRIETLEESLALEQQTSYFAGLQKERLRIEFKPVPGDEASTKQS